MFTACLDWWFSNGFSGNPGVLRSGCRPMGEGEPQGRHIPTQPKWLFFKSVSHTAVTQDARKLGSSVLHRQKNLDSHLLSGLFQKELLGCVEAGSNSSTIFGRYNVVQLQWRTTVSGILADGLGILRHREVHSELSKVQFRKVSSVKCILLVCTY